MPRALYEHHAHAEALRVIGVEASMPLLTVFLVRRHDMLLTPAAKALIRWVRHHATHR